MARATTIIIRKDGSFVAEVSVETDKQDAAVDTAKQIMGNRPGLTYEPVVNDEAPQDELFNATAKLKNVQVNDRVTGSINSVRVRHLPDIPVNLTVELMLKEAFPELAQDDES